MTSPHPQSLPPSAPSVSRALRALLASGRIWAWVPALLLVGLIGTQLSVLGVALDDPAFATEDDYYRKGVDWDAQMARRRHSLALGWSARAHVTGAGDRSQLSVRLLDAGGKPVAFAQVRAVAFHNARAAQSFTLELHESAPGEYAADLGSARPGLWELRLSATRGSDEFESTLRFDVPGGRPT